MTLLRGIYHLVWGAPTLILILSLGLYLTVRTGFSQLRLLPKALERFLGRCCGNGGNGGKSSFRAVCTALAATVGTGNLAGVAGAIAIGGPGAVFWMWISGILGMIIKFAEATLSVRYRYECHGEILGGPMYMIRCGLPQAFAPLAGIYAFFGVVAAFGVGNATQINTVIGAFQSAMESFGFVMPCWTNLVLGLFLAVLVGRMLLGGANRIGGVAERLVPFAAGLYLLLGFAVLWIRLPAVPSAFCAIFSGAFSPSAVTGGVVGSAFASLRTGVSRGVFTNEAGMGTAAIAHASAEVAHPVEQGLMGIVEVFLDTIVICTITALVILCSGVSIPYGSDVGVQLTASAFSAVLGRWSGPVLTLCLCLFALATVLGWGLYGIRCAQYLLGNHVWRGFAWVQTAVVFLSAVLRTDMIWRIAEIFNGLMAVPNLIALLVLSPELITLYKSYKNGGRYENLHQCKPL